MRAGVSHRWAEPGTFSRDVETIARRTIAVALLLGVLVALQLWIHATTEARALARAEREPSCESLGFPAAIPGAPAAVTA